MIFLSLEWDVKYYKCTRLLPLGLGWMLPSQMWNMLVSANQTWFPPFSLGRFPQGAQSFGLNLTNSNGSMDIGRQWKGLRCVDQQPQKNLFQSQSWIGLGFPILGFNARPKLVPFECQFLCPVPVSGAWLLMSEGFWCNWSWWILSCVLHVWVITLILGPSLPAPSPTQGSHRRARCSPDKCVS